VIALAPIALAVLAQLPATQTDSSGDGRAARLARWREALELDLAQEVLAEGPVLVASGGALERDGEALALVARARALRGDETGARELLEAAHADQATRGHVELERARLALDRDELAVALALLSADSKLRFPELPESFLLLGRVRVRMGESAQAEPWLKKFVELAPLSPEAPAAWHMLGQVALAKRDLASARACAQREERLGRWQAYYRARRLQIREKPSEPLPRLGLAQLWLEIDQPARAKTVLEELTGLAPSFCPGWFTLGEAERNLGELEPAHAHYTRALECDPEQSLARYNRAVIDRLAGRDAQARADFERLVQGRTGEDPRFLGAHLELARILSRAGEEDAARERYAVYGRLGGKEPLEPAQPAGGR
jgi:tetratricopeptide (TPR) repeat protein